MWIIFLFIDNKLELPARPVESHSGARENIFAGPPNIFWNFLKWCILVYFILKRRRGLKRRGARGNLNPHLLDN